MANEYQDHHYACMARFVGALFHQLANVESDKELTEDEAFGGEIIMGMIAEHLEGRGKDSTDADH